MMTDKNWSSGKFIFPDPGWATESKTEEKNEKENAKEEEENEKLKQLEETEILILEHDELKKTFKKRLRTIAEKSRNLVLKQVKQDERRKLVESIGNGISSIGNGISFLGAFLIPFVPPVGMGISGAGAGVGVLGYLILGVNDYYKIKAEKGKKELAQKEFNSFKEEMKKIIAEYDKSSMAIIENLSVYPEVAGCEHFASQLQSIVALVEKYNKYKDGKYPLAGLLKLTSIMMGKNNELMNDENTKRKMDKIVEATKEEMQNAVSGLASQLETLDMEEQEYKEEKQSHYPITKIAKPLLGSVFTVAKPIVEQCNLPGQMMFKGSNVGMGSLDAYLKVTAAHACASPNVTPLTGSLALGTTIFGCVSSFVFMCINGHKSVKAYKKYEGLRDLIDKAEGAGDDKEQLRVLMEKDKYKHLAGKAIATIEVANVMIEILDEAI